jgi:hypothetical protein
MNTESVFCHQLQPVKGDVSEDGTNPVLQGLMTNFQSGPVVESSFIWHSVIHIPWFLAYVEC